MKISIYPFLKGVLIFSHFPLREIKGQKWLKSKSYLFRLDVLLFNNKFLFYNSLIYFENSNINSFFQLP